MKSCIWLLALCTVAVPCFAQEHPALTAPPNTVFVGADGKFEAAPDTGVIQFNVSVQDDTSQAAYQHASTEVEKVRQILRSNGIEPKAASLGLLSVQPQYDWKNPKHKVI